MAKTITKGLIGVQDISIGTSTFTRSTSTGGTNTMTQVQLGSFATSTATSATAGANGDVPAQVLGYIVTVVNGTSVKIPYYNT